jgi:hypothetical protein
VYEEGSDITDDDDGDDDDDAADDGDDEGPVSKPSHNSAPGVASCGRS